MKWVWSGSLHFQFRWPHHIFQTAEVWVANFGTQVGYIKSQSMNDKLPLQVRPSSGTAVYPHMPILSLHHCDIMLDAGVACTLADSSNFGLLEEQSSPKREIPCPRCRWTTVHRAKFDAASFILGGEILNRTKSHTHTNYKKKQTNSKCYIHTLPIRMCGQKRGVV